MRRAFGAAPLLAALLLASLVTASAAGLYVPESHVGLIVLPASIPTLIPTPSQEPITATLHLLPNPLHHSHSPFDVVAGRLCLPSGYDADDVERDSLRLCAGTDDCGTAGIQPLASWVGFFQDIDINSMRATAESGALTAVTCGPYPCLYVVFSRFAVIGLASGVPLPADVAFSLSGSVGGERFVGTDTVRVLAHRHLPDIFFGKPHAGGGVPAMTADGLVAAADDGSIVVQNGGEIAAAPFWVAGYADRAADGAADFYWYVPGLEPGAGAAFSLAQPQEQSLTLAPGVHELWLVANSGHAGEAPIDEGETGNNQAGPFTITVALATATPTVEPTAAPSDTATPTAAATPVANGALPDLRVSGAWLGTPTETAAGWQAPLRVTVRNAGSGDATGFWLAAYVDGAESPSMTWVIPVLPAGASVEVSSDDAQSGGDLVLAGGAHELLVRVNLEGCGGVPVPEAELTDNVLGPLPFSLAALPTATVTVTASPTGDATPTGTPTEEASAPTVEATATPTATETAAAPEPTGEVAQPTPAAEPTATPTATGQPPTDSPTETPTVEPPTATPTPAPSPTDTPTPQPPPTATPVPPPTETPTPVPTATPVPLPTATPTPEPPPPDAPTAVPLPTDTPTPEPPPPDTPTAEPPPSTG